MQLILAPHCIHTHTRTQKTQKGIGPYKNAIELQSTGTISMVHPRAGTLPRHWPKGPHFSSSCYPSARYSLEKVPLRALRKYFLPPPPPVHFLAPYFHLHPITDTSLPPPFSPMSPKTWLVYPVYHFRFLPPAALLSSARQARSFSPLPSRDVWLMTNFTVWSRGLSASNSGWGGGGVGSRWGRKLELFEGRRC